METWLFSGDGLAPVQRTFAEVLPEGSLPDADARSGGPRAKYFSAAKGGGRAGRPPGSAITRKPRGAPTPRWIVVSGVTNGTLLETLQRLPRWKVLVVEDSKTPKDLTVPQGIHFLSLLEQSRLNFSISKFVGVETGVKEHL
jgi:hypothetical protein